MIVPLATLTELFNSFFWPFVRIAALLMVAPIFSGSMVAPQVRIIAAVTLTIVVAPLVPPAPAVDPLSLAGGLVTVQQMVIGVAMGFALQMVFDSLIIAGQAIAMSMGLGFAVAVDPQRGVNVPVVSQYFVVLATLIFLALNGHVLIVHTLVDSFSALPVGATGLPRAGLWQLVSWGSVMFSGALQVALPAMVSLLIVNLSFGVISRAAPTLNLFAVGFPITMLLGFLILFATLPNGMQTFVGMLNEAFANASGILTARGAP